MSVPTASLRQCDEKQFYGRAYPRTNVRNGSNTANAPPSATAPLLDWASKAEWKHGGGHQHQKHPPKPKAPYTPLYAFLAAKQLKIQKENPSLTSKQVLVLAKADAAEDWGNLTNKEHELYVKMAQEDAQRYEDEVAAFKQKYPDAWVEGAKSRTKSVKLVDKAKAIQKPRAALTAWRAFLEEFVQKAVAEGRISEDSQGLKKQISVMEDAAKLWKAMSKEAREPFALRAEEDKERFEAELNNFPEYKMKLQEKQDAKDEASKQRAAKKAIYMEAKRKGDTSKKPVKGVRAARKRALPKPKPLVKGGVFVGKGSEAGGPRKRRRQATTSQKELAEGDSEVDDSEEEEDYKSSSSSEEEEAEEDASEDEDLLGEDEGGIEAEPEEAPEPAEPRDLEDDEPDLSEDEDDMHADKENHAPSTIQKSAMYAADFVADTPAVQGKESEDEEDLRAATQPEHLLASKTEPKDGIFGWAKSALMTGFKGMWARGGSQTPAEPSAKKSPKGSGKKRKR